ncbi:hypothetical protein [Marinilactibacillus psychrotolerans]|uniref:DUF2513 domain-containing protein n=1 Tax=Marinilactibacillus psychrotolerans TaxID=191770 RepID=A0AAV3WR88_9LACT|nr:hypothetical protein [Marinilactibacillus psychrotolerans]GEL66566.1 hypothetical protein MPS01_07210 [Marinilactibacillus psychrotolerans]GEQ35088.1 hypothetical protein M132T_05960 [Marinilactibacillus psychrotolerans]SDD21892.1 hypothetical protein SAMN04488013_12126 [Marinilactibacillus psychrotolerans]
MTTPTITLMDAYMMETLFSKGIQKEDFLHTMKERKLDKYMYFDDSFDYSELNSSVKDKEDLFEDAIKKNQYTISYLTIGGLKNLLNIKYGFVEEKDYILYDQKLENLTVDHKQLKEIKALVKSAWRVIESGKKSDDSMTISISHVSIL